MPLYHRELIIAVSRFSIPADKMWFIRGAQPIDACSRTFFVWTPCNVSDSARYTLQCDVIHIYESAGDTQYLSD